MFKKRLNLKTKKLKRGIAVLAMTAVAITGNNIMPKVQAAEVKSSSYSLFYNSEGSYSKSATCKITFYAGTNYFKCSSISGGADSIVVNCTGYNVSLSRTLKTSKVNNISFVPTLKSDASNTTQSIYTVKMTQSPSTSTAYANGSVYIN